ncbi:MAG: aldo/keto reductase [Tannerellaceae bacterium]|jgi:aryl-alcohol dehydrogenase-like predicted oxidoreductase|nr:aldo/keto reductase [Tannerellaceae bacterium]
MSKMNRRIFIKTGVAGVAALSVTGPAAAGIRSLLADKTATVGTVALGSSGLIVPRMAMGTGSVGYNQSSNQTRLGMDSFLSLARRAYERGVRFYDMADGYGSHPYVAQALKTVPRESVTLLSKIWTHEPGSDKIEPVRTTLDRFRAEVGTEYFDILLMHCMTSGGWTKSREHYIDGLSRAKEDGIVKAVGVSCHSYDALVEAASSPWIDVIMARINPFQSKMDGTPADISAVLKTARANGKGIIGMKIFGEGTNVREDERETSLQYAFSQGNVHCTTIGTETVAQLDDAADRVARITGLA